MQISQSFQALLFLVSIIAVNARAGIGSTEEKRAACNEDNVLRALQHTASSNASQATSLCESLILYGVPAVTVVPPPGGNTGACVSSISILFFLHNLAYLLLPPPLTWLTNASLQHI